MDFDGGTGKRASVGSSGAGMGLSQSRAERATQKRLTRTESGLRLLSPVSQGDSDEVVEAVDAEEDDGRPYDDDDDNNQNLNTAPTSPLAQRGQQHSLRNFLPAPDETHLNPSTSAWQQNVEAHLHALKTEIAALREQLSANHLLSSSTYSVGAAYYTLSTRQRILHRAKLYIRTYTAFFLRQLLVQCGLLAVVLMWGRVKGDPRVEDWVKASLIMVRKRLRSVFGAVAFWLLEVFGRDGRLRFVGRMLRIH